MMAHGAQATALLLTPRAPLDRRAHARIVVGNARGNQTRIVNAPMVYLAPPCALTHGLNKG